MGTINNFDQSSTGENITLDVFWDIDESYLHYDEFIECEATHIQFGCESSIYLIGNTDSPLFTRSRLNKTSKAEVFAAWGMYGEKFGYVNDPNQYKKSEYIDDLLTLTVLDHYKNAAEKYDWNTIQGPFKHDYYISRGYSQGDARYVISIDEPLTPALRKHIDHILWDAPVVINLTVNDAEYYTDTFLDDPYEYDKDEVIKKLNALPLSDYVKTWVKDNLPSHPDYR